MNKSVTVSLSLRSVILVIATILGLAFLFFIRDIVVLFILSYILASAIKPIANRLEKFKIPRILSIVLVLALVGLAIYLIFRVLVPPIVTESNNLIERRFEIANQINSYFGMLPGQVENGINSYVDQLPDKIREFFFSTRTFNSLLGFFAGFGGIITVLLVSFYMVLEKTSFENWVLEYWPGRDKEKARKAFRNADIKVSLWVRGQLILSFSIGLLTYIGLSILGIEYAPILALIAAFTELIPYVGPIIGAIPAVIFAFLEAPILALWVALLYFGIQQFEANVLVPQVMKRAVGISAVGVIFALLTGAKLFGILGAIIAVPVAASMKVIYDSFNDRRA